MTFSVGNTAKPRLRKENGFWICGNGLARGWGPTYEVAYADWKRQKEMWERIHREDAERQMREHEAKRPYPYGSQYPGY